MTRWNYSWIHGVIEWDAYQVGVCGRLIKFYLSIQIFKDWYKAWK